MEEKEIKLSEVQARLNTAALDRAVAVALPGTHHAEVVESAKAFRDFLISVPAVKEQA